MESIETLNQRLIDHYGSDSDTNRPIFRIVWADDQTEKRKVYFLDSGIALLHPILMEVKKYSYLEGLYVLERLVLVPDMDREELAGLKLSYEPIWAYKDGDGNPLPPIWPATKMVIDVLYAALGKKSLAKYTENTSPEAQEERIQKLSEELFGNETETGDAMAYGEAVVVPRNYEKEN